MKLSEAIREIITLEGEDILKQKKLINYLNDYSAFKENKSAKYIIKLLIEKDYFSRIIDSEQNNLSLIAHDISSNLDKEFGVNKSSSLEAINDIFIGLGKSPIDIKENEECEDEPLFKIKSDLEQQIITCANTLSATFDECAKILKQQGKIEECIVSYKIGANKGDNQCLIELTKLYISEKGVKNITLAKNCCNKYYNTFFDCIENRSHDEKDISKDIYDRYAKGFLEILRCAVTHDVDIISHKYIEFLIIGPLLKPISNLVNKEFRSLTRKVNKITSDAKKGVSDISYSSSKLKEITKTQKEFDLVQVYLSKLLDRIQHYKSQKIGIKRINVK